MFHSRKQKKNASKKKNKNISKKFNKTKITTKGSSVEVKSQDPADYCLYQSQCRLKAAWANIIKRYKDISAEETDVIDLSTEEVVVDRGILQKESESNEISCYEESSGNVTNMEETFETFEVFNNDDSYSKKELLVTRDEQLDSEIALSVDTTSSSQRTESISQSDQSRLKIYSFDTFDSGHDSEFYDSDDEEMCAQLKSLDYVQQDTIDFALNYYQVEPIDYSQQETFQFPPVALTKEQQRLWLEPASEDYVELSTWTGTYSGFLN
ncbi:513_t:CDS:2 [Funneliformis geosporum]|uniref:513_t:CDS:1 n=1 Tax=Funneliformis geosporum TaxID=1117311 RepID=A0A9W4SYW6_9GLOM|nr:513_t:CDS:2 [Funneliformis geosporum]